MRRSIFKIETSTITLSAKKKLIPPNLYILVVSVSTATPKYFQGLGNSYREIDNELGRIPLPSLKWSPLSQRRYMRRYRSKK